MRRVWVFVVGVLLGFGGAVAGVRIYAGAADEADYCLFWNDGADPSVQVVRSEPGFGSDVGCAGCVLTMNVDVRIGRDRFVKISEDGCGD